jgi:hypothetical protein
MPRLIIDTPDQRRLTFDGGTIRFGRRQDLELVLVDPTTMRPAPAMNNHVGSFVSVGEGWVLENPGVGTRPGTMFLYGIDVGPATAVAPGCRIDLSGAGAIVFAPGNYRLTYKVVGPAPPPRPPAREEGTGFVPTVTPIELSARMVDFLVALAEPELRDMRSGVRRGQKEIAALWGVKPATVAETLRAVRERLVEVGLMSAEDAERQNSADILARVAVIQRLVTYKDVVWADLRNPNGPRPAEIGPRFSPERRP